MITTVDSSEPTTASVTGDANSQANPFFNVSLPSQRTIQDIDINKGSDVNQDDQARPKYMDLVSTKKQSPIRFKSRKCWQNGILIAMSMTHKSVKT
jgi:hypothetical protein